MQLNKADFIASHAKAGGVNLADKLYAQLQAKIKSLPDCPLKVYLSATGGEVHVKGSTTASLKKPETLQEKIARFDRLAAQVSQSRAINYGLAQELEDDDSEIDAEADDFEDIVETDDFGEIVAKPAKSAGQVPAGSANGSAQPAGDEPASEPAQPSAMDDGGSADE